jgi:hypothetical protein
MTKPIPADRVELARAVYDYYRTIGDVGDAIRTDLHPWLMATYGVDVAGASRLRRIAKAELEHRRLVRREAQGHKLEILAEWTDGR